MGKVFAAIGVSVDGYVAGPNQSLEHPLGEGGEHIHDWMLKTKFWHEMPWVGDDGGETGPSDTVLREASANIGAYIMGRNMFGGGTGPWPEPAWNGWWGDNPPYHTPVFVLTHHAREPLVMQGGTTFFFVSEGIESALKQAKDAAGDRDIRVAGGAATVRQYLNAGAVDELMLHVAPILLGRGARLLEGVDPGRIALRIAETVAAPDVTHLRYEVTKK
jgi:dihydrofolate reductase